VRQLLIAAAAVALAGLSAGAARADKWEMKNVHLCCPSCVKAAEGILAKVDGVSDVKADRAKKTISFTAKDYKAAGAAYQALTDGGFYGEASNDSSKPLSLADPPKADKAGEVTVKNVHICCNSCKKAVTGLFEGSKVEFPAKNEVKITGKDLDKVKVIQTLRKAGFNGKAE